MILGTIRNRVYSDFFMSSRLEAYEAFLRHALDAGYTTMSIERYWQGLVDGLPQRDRPILLMRHDVDTDPATQAQMWEIERRLGVEGSFFFRLSTLDVGLMQAIAGAGSGASYHYEELATVAKARRPRTLEDVQALIPEAQELFARNLDHLRAVTGLPMQVVASHGDFLNRKLGMRNLALLADAEVRERTGVILETYDPALMDTVTSYHRDIVHPDHWMYGDPAMAVDRREPVVHVLVHPRAWRVNRAINLRDDIGRVTEELAFRLPTRSGPTAG